MIEGTSLDPARPEAMPWTRAAEQLAELRPIGGSRGPTC
jgi:hypothetical protein